MYLCMNIIIYIIKKIYVTKELRGGFYNKKNEKIINRDYLM